MKFTVRKQEAEMSFQSRIYLNGFIYSDLAHFLHTKLFAFPGKFTYKSAAFEGKPGNRGTAGISIQMDDGLLGHTFNCGRHQDIHRIQITEEERRGNTNHFPGSLLLCKFAGSSLEYSAQEAIMW